MATTRFNGIAQANVETDNHVIIVCCHGIWLGGRTAGEDENEWLLEAFQAGESGLFREHVKTGLKIAREQGGELWFSGGPTKKPRTEFSEGESYLALAQALLEQDHLNSVKETAAIRMYAETFATDSLQNVLFPLLLWLSRANDGQHLQHLTIVSHAFKRSRFLDLHLPALGFSKTWIETNVEYVGLDPIKDAEGQQLIERGEAKACQEWRNEPLASKGDLRKKRTDRGWNDERVERLMEFLQERGAEESLLPVYRYAIESGIDAASLILGK